jgi:hypothetical protein
VDRDHQTAKFWLAPVGLARNDGFGARELRQLEAIVAQHQRDLIDAWRSFFG